MARYKPEIVFILTIIVLYLINDLMGQNWMEIILGGMIMFGIMEVRTHQ